LPIFQYYRILVIFDEQQHLGVLDWKLELNLAKTGYFKEVFVDFSSIYWKEYLINFASIFKESEEMSEKLYTIYNSVKKI